MELQKVLYETQATATGGRDGRAVTSDGLLDVRIVPPRELGGAGGATNPEQLFAAGYAACFLSAIKAVAGRQKIAVSPEASVAATVGIGTPASGTGYGLQARLQVSLPGLEPAVAQGLVDAAHRVCPYSNATRGNIRVDVALA